MSIGRWLAVVVAAVTLIIPVAPIRATRMDINKVGSGTSSRINGRLAFGGFRGGIMTINPNGTGLKRLSRSGVAPAWSPDGRKILFEVGKGKSKGIWVMRGDGTRQRRVASGRSPAWAPDGEQIVFTMEFRRSGIYVMRADGTHVRRVLSSGVDPRWSPNGKQIVFWELDTKTPIAQATAQVFVMNVHGGTPRQLTNSRGADNLAPTWSPDGRKIAYITSGCPRRPDSIVVMNPDGSAKSKVFTSDAPSCSLRDLTWSPDGQKFAYSASSRRTFTIEVINADGSAPRRLIPNQPDGTGISWQSLPRG